MREFSELAKRDARLLMSTYVLLEVDGSVIDLYPDKKTVCEELTMIFITEDNNKSFILEPEDLTWVDYTIGDFDFKISKSSGIESEIEFTRLKTGDKLARFLDRKIGQRMLKNKCLCKNLNMLYFFAAGNIYPATDSPMQEKLCIYDMATEKFEIPYKIGESYYISNMLIEKAPTELWPIIKNIANIR